MIKVLFVLILFMDGYRSGFATHEFYKEVDCNVAATQVKAQGSSYTRAICVRKEIP